MKLNTKIVMGLGSVVLAMSAGSAGASCKDVTRADLQAAVDHAASLTGASTTGGYGLEMWLTFVDESGKVCDVLTSGTAGANASRSEWLGSRVISAQKANTANAFSLNGYAISTANLYSAVQPGGSLFGLQFSNPVDPTVAYQGGASQFGTASDPLRNKRVGGINVFGGGLALYKSTGTVKIGAIGVSGDTSCRDHAFAWNVREHLGLHPAGTGITTSNMNPAGVSQTKLDGATKGDEMILKQAASDGDNYWAAWSQPECPNSAPAATTANGTLVVPTPVPTP